MNKLSKSCRVLLTIRSRYGNGPALKFGKLVAARLIVSGYTRGGNIAGSVATWLIKRIWQAFDFGGATGARLNPLKDRLRMDPDNEIYRILSELGEQDLITWLHPAGADSDRPEAAE